MKSISRKLLLRYILFNIAASAFLLLILWYTGRFTEGILDKIGLVLYLPSFYILVLFQGLNETMHFTDYSTELLVSYFFYSSVIALIEVIIYKLKKRRQDRLVRKDSSINSSRGRIR